jgi:hypothetical protein
MISVDEGRGIASVSLLLMGHGSLQLSAGTLAHYYYRPKSVLRVAHAQCQWFPFSRGGTVRK